MATTQKAGLISAGLLLASAILLAAAQSPDAHPVPLHVTVTDDLGRLVTDLPSGAFQIFEDKVPQPIVSFSRDDAPLSIGIVFDTSASMGNTLEQSQSAIKALFSTANPEDEAFLVEFGDRPELAAPMTHDLNWIQSRLAAAEPRGRTALPDGIYLALDTLKAAHNPRKVLIVISDGADTSSRYKASEVANLIGEANVQIYTAAVFGSAGRTRGPEVLAGSEMLRALSEPTGGRHFLVESPGELRDIGAKIGMELRSQYAVGYTPTNQARDGKYRRITVKLAGPQGLRAFWKTGYFAPAR